MSVAGPDTFSPFGTEEEQQDAAEQAILDAQPQEIDGLKQEQQALSSQIPNLDAIEAEAKDCNIPVHSNGKVKAAVALDTNDPTALSQAIGDAKQEAQGINDAGAAVFHQQAGQAVATMAMATGALAGLGGGGLAALSHTLAAAEMQGFKTIVTGMNALEASPSGVIVNNYEGLENLGNLARPDTPSSGITRSTEMTV